MPGLDRPPPDPYVRDLLHSDREWHIAVHVRGDDSVILRCGRVPLHPPIEWRADPPEISIDAVMCPRCLIV